MRIFSKFIMFALFITSMVNKSISVYNMQILQYGGGNYSSQDSSSNKYDIKNSDSSDYGSTKYKSYRSKKPAPTKSHHILATPKNIKKIKNPKDFRNIIKVIAKKINQINKKPRYVQKIIPKTIKKKIKPKTIPNKSIVKTVIFNGIKQTKNPTNKFKKSKSHPKYYPKKVNKYKPNKRPT